MSLIRHQGILQFGMWNMASVAAGTDACAAAVPTDTRKRVLRSTIVGRFPLTTDPVGNCVITISGIHDGSEATIFDNTGSVIASIASTSGVTSFSIPYYSVGNVNNNIRVFIISAGYEVLDFNYTLTGSNATIPVFQRVDRNYTP